MKVLDYDDPQMKRLYANEPVLRRQAIQLTNLSRLFIGLLIVKGAIYLLSGSLILDVWAKLFTIPLLLVVIGLLAVTCHLFESGQDTRGRFALASIISGSCMLSVVMCGGFLSSLATPILIFPVVLSFSILPIKWARRYFVAIIGIPLGMDIAFRLMTITPPNFTSASNPAIIVASVMFTLCAALYFCLAYWKQAHHGSVPSDS
ncbi:MAG: hypothetical protein AAGF28_00590 [Pseudomonadota bacterium]